MTYHILHFSYKKTKEVEYFCKYIKQELVDLPRTKKIYLSYQDTLELYVPFGLVGKVKELAKEYFGNGTPTKYYF